MSQYSDDVFVSSRSTKLFYSANLIDDLVSCEPQTGPNKLSGESLKFNLVTIVVITSPVVAFCS